MAKKSSSVPMIALLRGINVGGKNMVPMPELKKLFESLGHGDVSTYIASGNVLFTSAEKPAEVAATAEAAIAKKFKVSTPRVVVRTREELAGAIAASPFKGDPARVLIGFCTDKPAGVPDPARSPKDEIAVVGMHVHMHCPEGIADSKFTADYLDRTLRTTVTFRNIRTCGTLLERLAALA